MLTPRKRAAILLIVAWSIHALRTLYTLAGFFIAKGEFWSVLGMADRWAVFVVVPGLAIAFGAAFYRGVRWAIFPLLVCGAVYFFYLGGMLSLIALLSLSPSWTTLVYVFMAIAHGYCIWVVARDWWRGARTTDQ